MGTTTREALRIAIVGSGFAGLGAAIRLRRAGFASVTIYERGDDVGGTWRDNTYPGCACDIRSHLYSFSFFRNPAWTREFPAQPEIEAYLQRCATHFGLRPLIRFGVEITEMRWNEREGIWALHHPGGTPFVHDVVINATGPLSTPSVPDLPGIDTFAGSMFHSARWDHDHDLAGRRVGVIGTGASAVQFVPEIAPVAADTTVFQRTAPWVLPRMDREFTATERRRFARFPLLSRWHRWKIYARQEMIFPVFRGDRRAERLIRDGWARFADAQGITGELRAQVTPTYAPGCKRLLITNDWYPALRRDDVSLVSARESPQSSATPSSPMTACATRWTR